MSNAQPKRFHGGDYIIHSDPPIAQEDELFPEPAERHEFYDGYAGMVPMRAERHDDIILECNDIAVPLAELTRDIGKIKEGRAAFSPDALLAHAMKMKIELDDLTNQLRNHPNLTNNRTHRHDAAG